MLKVKKKKTEVNIKTFNFVNIIFRIGHYDVGLPELMCIHQ